MERHLMENKWQTKQTLTSFNIRNPEEAAHGQVQYKSLVPSSNWTIKRPQHTHFYQSNYWRGPFGTKLLCGPPRVACIHLFTALLGLNSFCKNVFIRLFSIFKNTEFDKFFFLNAIKLRKARAVSSVVHAALARVRSLRRRLSLCPRSLWRPHVRFFAISGFRIPQNVTKQHKAASYLFLGMLFPCMAKKVLILQLSVTLNDIHYSLKTVALEWVVIKLNNTYHNFKTQATKTY